MIQPYPLLWPPNWPREQQPQRSKFAATIYVSEIGVRHELDLLGASDVVITSNAARNRNGSISTRQPYIEDTGVATYFTLRGEPRVIPCDKWLSIAENLRATEKMVNAIRGLERWGARMMVDAAFTGFAALPATTAPSWTTVLGVPADASRPQIDAAYRERLKRAHPDVGGSAEQFRELQEAYRAATSQIAA